MSNQKIKIITFIFGLLLTTSVRGAQEVIRATIEAKNGQSGWFALQITNTSDKTIRFLDVKEGTGWCGEFYEITIYKDKNRYDSNGNCFYAPAGDPEVVELAPGQTYQRNIQPVAYLSQAEKYLKSPYTIMVTYRLTDKIKKMWASKADKADLNFTYQARIKINETSKNER